MGEARTCKLHPRQPDRRRKYKADDCRDGHGYAKRAGQPDIDLFSKPFGSPEAMKAMREMASAFEDDLRRC